jgi:tetratricopeptide (TPR) repeat protein
MLSQQYRALGDVEYSLQLANEALSIARRVYEENDPRLGAAEAAAARFTDLTGNNEQGAALLQSAIEKMRGEADVYAPHLINALVAHSGLQSQNQNPAAIDSLTEALALARLYFGDDSLSAALVHAQTASVLSASGNFGAAEPEFGRALDIYDMRLGPEHGATIAAFNNFALMFLRMGDFTRAEMILRDVVARHEAKYGTEYFETATAYQNLATALSRQSRYEESLPLHRRAAEIYRAVLPGDNQVAAFPHLSMAHAHLELGDPATAEPEARRALDILDRTAPDTWMAGVAECLLGISLDRRGTGDAEVHFESARTLMARATVPEPYQSLCPVDSR